MYLGGERSIHPAGAEALLAKHQELFTFLQQLRTDGVHGVVGLIPARPRPLSQHPFASNILRQPVCSEDILLVRRVEGGVWTNPAGHVEPNDRSPFETLAWEALQETGLRTRKAVDYVLSDLLDVGYTRSGKWYLLFKACVNSSFMPQILEAQTDINDVRWFSAEEAYNLIKKPPAPYQQYLLRYLDGWDKDLEQRIRMFFGKLCII